MKILFTLLFGIFFSGIINAQSFKTIEIFQTTDIHSHIFNKDSSWLHIASLIHNLREKNGGRKNTLLIDCGDTLLGSVSGLVSHGKASASMLNFLGYDAWIMGNHDFEIGEKRLIDLSRFIKADKLIGNLNWKSGLIQSWKIYRKNDVDIAVIGLTSPYLHEWLWGKETEFFSVSPIMDAMDRIVPEVMEAKPDIIVLAVHHGRFSPKRLKGLNLSLIVKKYPQVDIVLGGHSHLEVAGEIIGDNSWFTLGGPHGKSVNQLTIIFDPKKKKLVKITSKLLHASLCNSINAEYMKKMQQFKNDSDIFKNKIIVSGKHKMKKSELAKLFGNALIEASGAMGAVISPPVYGQFFNNKIITEKDLFAVEPYDDVVCILYLTKQQIKKITAEQNNKRKLERYQLSHRLKNIDFKAGERIPVAFSSYLLAGAGGRFPVVKAIAEKVECKGRRTAISVRQALRNYLKKHKVNLF